MSAKMESRKAITELFAFLAKGTTQYNLMLFGINGAIGLAFLGALVGAWDIPAARIAFGKTAIFFFFGALFALTGILFPYWRQSFAPLLPSFSGDRGYDVDVIGGSILAFISLICVFIALAIATYKLQPCFTAAPPVACQPQDWDAQPQPQGDRRKHGPLSFTGD
jgi:hypothetical protein